MTFMRENEARDHTERRVEKIVLWHGQYRNDAPLELLDRFVSVLSLSDVRMEGRDGDWRIVADAFVATPEREGFAVSHRIGF
jgi:hypothetical protein